MSIRQRLDRLERDAGGRPCPVCGGGRVVTVQYSDLIDGKSPSDPCPTCGREPVGIIDFSTAPALGEGEAALPTGGAA